MKRKQLYLFTLAASLCATTAIAQNVAINEDGSAPNPNAMLDIKSFTKGLLIPRVSTSGRLAIPNTRGLLVYDTTVNSFWYNTGAGWQGFAAASGFWSLNGNSGTDSSSFLGTKDNKPLILKVNNQPAGMIDANFTNNTAFGFNASGISTNGQNTAIGAFSLQSSTSGGYNTAVGSQAMQTNTTGNFNTAIGVGSMGLIKGGDNNTAIGAYTLQKNTTGFYNMAFGGGALERNTTGLGNIGIGYESLFWDTSGSQNTAVGLFTLLQNTNGTANTAMGSQTLVANTTGGSNTAIGFASLTSNTTGTNNVVLGAQTMNTNVTGSNNIAIGSGANVSAGNLFNAIAIGAGATVNASNKIRLGNSAVTVIEGQVPFTTPSDGRFKYNVQENVKGLAFIEKLRPVTYQFDVKRFDTQQGRQASAGTDAADYAIQASYNVAAQIRRSGFIAQEVEKAAKDAGYNFSGINKPTSEQDHYSLSYESFVVPLVKAVQEINAKMNMLEKENNALKQKTELLKQEVELLKKAPSSSK